MALHLMIVYTPFFNDIFRTQPLTWTELAIKVLVSSLVFWAVELQKLVSWSKGQLVMKLPVTTASVALPVAAAA